MTSVEIHKQYILPAVREAAKNGATAKELSDYLTQAAKGRAINAAFCMDSETLLQALKEEV